MIYVIATGGKQYLVKSGQTVRVEKLDGVVGDKTAVRKEVHPCDCNIVCGGDIYRNQAGHRPPRRGIYRNSRGIEIA